MLLIQVQKDHKVQPSKVQQDLEVLRDLLNQQTDLKVIKDQRCERTKRL